MAKKILLADDSVTIQKVVELTFMDQNYEVTSVSNGDEALARLAESVPDLLITDVHMPGANGYQVCSRAKAASPELPVLLLVGTFEPFEEREAEACGADRYLKKPFDSQQLLQIAGELLAGREETGDAEQDEAALPTPDEPAELPVSAAESTQEEVEAPAEPLEAMMEADPFSDLEPLPEPQEDLEASAAAEVEDEDSFDPSVGLETQLIRRDWDIPADLVADEGASVVASEESLPPGEAVFGESLEAGEVADELAEIEVEGALEVGVLEAVESATEAAPEVLAEAAGDRSAGLAAEGEEEAAVSEAISAVESSNGTGSGERFLADGDVERIARRVAELLGERVVREIAWDVIPDMAEVVIRERIRELESQVES